MALALSLLGSALAPTIAGQLARLIPGAALFATSLAAMILAPIGYSFVLFRKLSSSGSS